MANQQTSQSEREPREAFSIGEAAAIWGIGRTTLYRAVSDGSLRTLKIGARRLVRRSDIEAFMESHSVARISS